MFKSRLYLILFVCVERFQEKEHFTDFYEKDSMKKTTKTAKYLHQSMQCKLQQNSEP